MTTSKIRLTYYNRIMWQTVLLPDGTRVVRPYRQDGRAAGAKTRYYRRPR
jgi:hypothetical protein